MSSISQILEAIRSPKRAEKLWNRIASRRSAEDFGLGPQVYSLIQSGRHPTNFGRKTKGFRYNGVKKVYISDLVSHQSTVGYSDVIDKIHGRDKSKNHPIVVDDSVIGGNHRINAAKLRGEKTILVHHYSSDVKGKDSLFRFDESSQKKSLRDILRESEIPFKKRSPEEAKEAFQRLLMDRWQNRLVGYGYYGRRLNNPVPRNIIPRPSSELEKANFYSYGHHTEDGLPILGVPTETIHSNQRSIGPKELKAKITGEFEKKYGPEFPVGAASIIYDPATKQHIVRDGNHRVGAARARGDAYVPGRVWIADHATKTLKPLMHPVKGVHVEWPPKD